jgi:NAD-dependent dihydropyrimidine dehydrogenase PreA subunit
MRIDPEKCIGCDECRPYCPVNAIGSAPGGTVSVIDQELCVECGCCLGRSAVCPVDAIFRPDLAWPRILREYFSNPHVKHPSTTGNGRGTEEMKTNDVTGRFTRGWAGVALEMGRPGVGTSVKDMQTVAMALARLGVAFEPANPVAELMSDPATGRFHEAVLNERFLSAIIELKIPLSKLAEVLAVVREVAGQIDTVFSLDLISRLEADGVNPTLAIARQAGFTPRPNAKINVGLGRPLFAGGAA